MGKRFQRNLVEYLFNALDNEHHEKHDTASISEKIGLTLADFLDQMPGAFFIYEATGDEKLLYSNAALVRMLGCDSMTDLIEHTGNSFKGIVHPDDLDDVETSIGLQISASQYDLDYVEYRLNHKKGETHWVEDYGHFVHHDKLGDIFYVFISDATEKIESEIRERQNLVIKQTESELKINTLIEEYDNERRLIDKENLRRLEVIEGLSLNYNSIFYVDLDSKYIIPYRVNKLTAEAFDDSLKSGDYLKFADDYTSNWVHPENKAAVREAMAIDNIRKEFSDSRSFFINYRCQHHDEIHHIQMRIVNVGKYGTSQVVLGIRNIDEEYNQEAAHKHMLENALDAAKRADAAKSIFLSNMSHDMRTPLNAIFGYTKLAHNYLDDKQALADYLDKIDAAGHQMLELTEKVLELSYTGSQSAHLNEEECDITDIVTGVYNLLYQKANRNKLDFAYSCKDITKNKVIADPEKLTQILLQLTDNAIKYTHPGGNVAIVLVQEQALPNGFTQYRFTVEDNGVGIGKDMLPRLFDPFEREHDSTSSGVFGAGIGLTIAKNFTEAMGGTITVDSTPGKGSVFNVVIGFRTMETANDLTDVQTILAEIKGRKILIVEDNEINLEIESEILAELGFSTDSAENGKVAVEKLIASPDDYYAVILMDIQMPVMDGREAAKIIRNFDNPTLSRIPIIALSANAFESDKHLSAKAGIDAHLPKPLDVQQLLETMSRVVSSRKASM